MSKEDNGHLMWRIGFVFNDMKQKLFDIKHNRHDSEKHGNALSFLEDCLTVITYLNQVYVRKGPERISQEKERFKYFPEEYFNVLHQVTHDKWSDGFYSNLLEVFEILEKKYQVEKATNALNRNDMLVGFYEETKSVYNKIIHAEQIKDQLKLAYAAKQIDGETTNFFGHGHQFPRLLDVIDDPAMTLEATLRHERILLDYL